MNDVHPHPTAGLPASAAPETTSLPHRLEAGMRAGEAAFTVMRAQYGALRAEEVVVRDGDDPEARHRMRVAVRRLRAALALFEPALPRRAPVFRERLDRIGTVLGAVRDLDVLKAQLTAWSGEASAAEADIFTSLGSIIEERRIRARLRAVAELSRGRTARSLDMFERFLVRGPVKRSRQARVAVLELAPELLEREYRKLVTTSDEMGSDAEPAMLHAVRIRCKHLRYAVEFFEPLYGKPARRCVKQLAAVQDLLGEHQDAVKASETLRAMALAPRRRPAARVVLTIGLLVGRSEERVRALRELFPDRYRKVTGRRWRKLIEEAERRRGVSY